MTRWVTTTKPAAELHADPTPQQTHEDGTTVTFFSTAFGKRFARLVEKSGFTFWMREVE